MCGPGREPESVLGSLAEFESFASSIPRAGAFSIPRARSSPAALPPLIVSTDREIGPPTPKRRLSLSATVSVLIQRGKALPRCQTSVSNLLSSQSLFVGLAQVCVLYSTICVNWQVSCHRETMQITERDYHLALGSFPGQTSLDHPEYARSPPKMTHEPKIVCTCVYVCFLYNTYDNTFHNRVTISVPLWKPGQCLTPVSCFTIKI